MHAWKALKVFISSTFLDMELERDRLARIFAGLKSEMAPRRLTLIPYDLRWREKHSREPIVRWCLEMVERCQYFIGLLGSRYGWRPAEDAGGNPNTRRVSVTHMEIERALSVIPKERRFFCLAKKFATEESEEDLESMRTLREKLEAMGERIYLFDDAADLPGIVEKGLKSAIDADYPPAQTIVEEYSRGRALAEIVEQKSRGFVGRKSQLDRLLEFAAQSDGGNYLMIYAVAGTGKSALAAKFIQEWRSTRPDVPAVCHFLGMSGVSRHVREILIHLAEQLKETGVIEGEIEADPVDLRSQVRSALEKCRRKLVVIVDGLDEVEPDGHDLLWLPRNIPPQVRVIVTTRPVDPWDALKRYDRVEQMELSPLSDPEIAEIIDCSGHRLSRSDRELLQQRAHGNPLFLKVALEEIGAGGLAAGQLATTIESLFEQILKRLCSLYGEKMIFDYLGLLSASRFGLAEVELRELLQTEEKSDVLLVAAHSLANFLVERQGLLQFFHPEFERSIQQTIGKREMRGYHRRLARYFRQKGMNYDRTLVEICYQEQWGEEYADLLGSLSDITYLTAKCRAGLSDFLAEDFERALTEIAVSLPRDLAVTPAPGVVVDRRVISLLAKAINLDLRFIRRHPEAVFQSLWNRCYWHDAPAVHAHYEEKMVADTALFRLAEWWQERASGTTWFKSRRPLEPHLSSPVKRILHGHAKDVLCVAMSADGRRIASGALDRLVRIWDVSSGECLAALEGHDREVKSVAFAPDGKRFASAAGDWLILVWDASSFECLQIVESREGAVNCVVFSGPGQVWGGLESGTVCLWDIESGKCLHSFAAHEKAIQSIAVAHGMVASGATDTEVCLWDIAQNTRRHTFKGHERIVTSVAFNPDGSLLASASKDATVRLWDTRSGSCVEVLSGHKELVSAVAFSPDGGRVIAAAEDGSVSIWDLRRREISTVLRKNDWRVTGIALSADGRLLSCSARDGSVSLWDLEDIEVSPIAAGHTAAIQAIAFTDDKRLMASASSDCTVRLWDTATGLCLRTLRGQVSAALNVAFGKEGKVLASGTDDGTVLLWDVKDGECIRSIHEHQGTVSSVFFLRQNFLVSTGFFDKTIRIWDLAEERTAYVLSGHEKWIQAIALSEDERLLASGSRDKTIRLWDTGRGSLLKVLRGHDSGITSLAFSEGGRLLASGSRKGAIYIWDTESGACRMVLRKHRAHVTGVCFDRENARLYSCSELVGSQRPILDQYLDQDKSQNFDSGDDTICIWDVENGECLELHHGKVDIRDLAKGETPLVVMVRDWETVLVRRCDWIPVAFFPIPISPAKIITGNVVGVSAGYVYNLEVR